jgi:hypothetical protein
MIRRILALIFIAGLAAAAAVYSPSVNLISGDPVKPHSITVQARDLALVCPGAAFVSGSSTKVGSFSQSGSASVFTHQAAIDGIQTSATLFGSTSQTLSGAESTFGASKSVVISSSDPGSLIDQGSALLTATQLQLKQDADMSGLAATGCQRPSSDIWLVGGDTRTGRESLLILANPTAVDATIELQLLASNGYLNVPGLSAISVPSHRSVIVPINGLAPKLQTFSVHVSARGGSVAAWIQQKTVRGLHAGGFDLIAPASPATTHLNIPGLLIRGTAAVVELNKLSSNYFDVVDTLRVANTSGSDSHILAQITGSNAKTFGTVIQATVPANTTADLEISGLSDGDYSIAITSDQPVRAAVRLNRSNVTAKPETDFTWLPAVSAAAGSRYLAVPSQGISKLAIVNPSKTVAHITVRSGGASTVFELKPGSLTSVKVTAGALMINSDAAVAATLVIDVSSSVASVPMVEYRNIGGQISVVVR